VGLALKLILVLLLLKSIINHSINQSIDRSTDHCTRTEPPAGFTLRVMRGEEVALVAQICVDAFAEQNKNTGCVPGVFYRLEHDIEPHDWPQFRSCHASFLSS
jgi:hypothetical protein